MDHLTALIVKQNGSASVRELTMAAGIPQNRLAYWLKPGSNVTRLPAPSVIEDIALAIHASPGDVFRAFVADLGYTWP